eukprot:572159-Prorocentrum_lima.AAC.1
MLLDGLGKLLVGLGGSGGLPPLLVAPLPLPLRLLDALRPCCRAQVPLHALATELELADEVVQDVEEV